VLAHRSVTQPRPNASVKQRARQKTKSAPDLHKMKARIEIVVDFEEDRGDAEDLIEKLRSYRVCSCTSVALSWPGCPLA
jgi:hypothetical protein